MKIFYIVISILIIIVSVFFLNQYIFPVETLSWKKFSSDRVPLSFYYPKEIPLTQCGKEWLSEPLNYLEFIRFSTSCDNELTNNVYGTIVVKNILDKTKDPLTVLPKSSLSTPLHYKK